MISRILIAAAALAVAMPAAAQQRAGGTVDPRKSQVLMFEDGLRTAVEVGGEEMSKRALEFVPVRLSLDGAPIAHGVPVKGYGYVFDVQVPDLSGAGVALVLMYQRAPGQVPAPRNAPPPAGSGRDGVIATGNGVVTEDPMTQPPTAAAGHFDPKVAYRDSVRAALIDAILDNSGVLSLADADTLLVTANGVDQSTPYRVSSSRLILEIKGADLAAFRQHTITRDEAKARIRETQF